LEGYRTLIIGLDPDRALLRTRLEERTRHMFADGLLEEVRGLLAQGLSGMEKPFGGLGYKQALNVLKGECTLEQAIESTIIATHQYAKRQRTWFRRDPAIQWLNSFGDESRSRQFAIVTIEEWLEKK
jgi:tRNA dimethylallyltransferase